MTWLNRTFIPYMGEVRTLMKAGYAFPEGLRVKPTKNIKGRDEDKFSPELYPGFLPGFYKAGMFFPINTELDSDYNSFSVRLNQFSHQ